MRERELTKNSVDRVHSHLILRGIADEALCVGEGDVGGGRPVPLVVGDNLNSIMLPHPDARVGRAEIDANRRALTLSGHQILFKCSQNRDGEENERRNIE